MAGVFFSVALTVFQSGDLVGYLDELLGQLLEELIIGHVGFDLFGLLGRNPFRTLASRQITLQNLN